MTSVLSVLPTSLFKYINNAELMISFIQEEYTVDESDGTISVNVMIMSIGGWAVPLEFMTGTQDNTAATGQNTSTKSKAT